MLQKRIVAYLAGLSLYLTGILIYTHDFYYQGFIGRSNINLTFVSAGARHYLEILFLAVGRSPMEALYHLFFAYALYGLILVVFKKDVDLAKYRPYVFWATVAKFFANNSQFLKGNVRQQKRHRDYSDYEKTTMRYFLVKFFFLPIMLNFLFGNVESLTSSIHNFFSLHETTNLVRHGYFSLLYIILTIDTLYFVVGYAFEFKNKSYVRSVEPTFFGWFVALICYPPFNDIGSKYLFWGSADYPNFGSTTTTIFILSLTIILFAIYGWATMALGLKSSNLTNRGIVSAGPYRFVRHPAYIAKNLSWFLLGIPVMNFHIIDIGSFAWISANWAAVFAILAWGFIYYLRALTEEKHLLADPDYQAYCNKVRYRFIPRVY